MTDIDRYRGAVLRRAGGRCPPMLTALCLLLAGHLHAEPGSLEIRVRLREPMTCHETTFPPGRWLTGTLVRLGADTLAVAAFRGSDPVAIPTAGVTACQVRESAEAAWVSVVLPLGADDDLRRAIAVERPRPGPAVEYQLFGGGIGVGGRNGHGEEGYRGVSYRYSTDPVRFGPGLGVACTALLAHRALFVTHDFQVCLADHGMRAYEWQGPQEGLPIRPGFQTSRLGLQQASTRAGICRDVGGGSLRLGGGLSLFLWDDQALDDFSGAWAGLLAARYGRCSGRLPWSVELRVNHALGREPRDTAITPTGYQLAVGTGIFRPQASRDAALVRNAVAGALCWLWPLSLLVVGE